MVGVRSEESRHESPLPTSEEVRADLRTLLGRNGFDASERNRRFLSYVVEETLAGRADRIKAYNIALAAFDRNDDFDPLTDPIVRIEASRLRRSLEHYYLTAGKMDRIRIDIPKGSYFASFSYQDDSIDDRHGISADVAAPTATGKPGSFRPWRRRLSLVLGVIILLIAVAGAGLYLLKESADRDTLAKASAGPPSIIVLPFEDMSGDVTQAFVARGLTYELIARLTRYKDLFVFGSDTSFTLDRPSGSSLSWEKIKPGFVLSGSVQTSSHKIRVSAILANGETGQYLWSSVVERNLSTSGLMLIQGEIASQVAAAIAQPYGIVFEQASHDVSSKPAETLLAFECVVRFRQYWRSYSDRDFDGVRTCLENTVASDPSYAPAFSSLAMVYVDAYRFGFGRSEIPFDPLERAVDLADHALKLDPDWADGYLARLLALWFLRDVEGSIQAAKRGLALHPHNTDLLAELGFRYALLAKWDDAMPLVAEAYARNPGAPTGYHIATFLHEYMTGDYKAALNAALKVDSPDVVYGPIARAVAYAQLGDVAKASREAAEVLRIHPNYAAEVDDDLARRNLDPAVARAIKDGLAKAGLHLAPTSN